MANVILFPGDLGSDGCERLSSALRSAVDRGEDTGSRRVQIEHLDALLDRTMARLSQKLAQLPVGHPVVDVLRAQADEVTALANKVRDFACELTREAVEECGTRPPTVAGVR